MAYLNRNKLGDVYLSSAMSNTDQITEYVGEISTDLINKMEQLKPDLTNYLSKSEGGEISGDVAIKNSQLNLLNGNYVQTTDMENVINYSPKNSFLQAERAKASYPIASTGSKGYCVISVIMPNKLELSSTGEPNEFSALIEHKDKLWSLAIDDEHESLALSVVSVDGNIVTFAEDFDIEIAKLSANTTDDFIKMFYTDDNALFQNEFPNEGNVVIQNFYGNHAEGGSVRAIGRYSHAEGRNNVAEGRYSHAEGSHNTSGGLASHTEGMYCFARGNRSHAEGTNASALGTESHAEGYYTKASGKTSHAEGQFTHADGWCSNTCGVRSRALSSHYTSFVWQGCNIDDIDKIRWDLTGYYESNAVGSFNVKPVNGLSGFYIGKDNFIQCVLSAVKQMTNDQKNELKTILGLS